MALILDKEDFGTRLGCYANLSIAYSNLADYSTALECNKKALEISIDWEFRDKEASCYIGIGNICDRMGKVEEALEFYKKALTIFEEIGDIAGIAVAFSGIGDTYVHLGMYKKGVKFYKKTMNIINNNDNMFGKWQTWNNIGVAYFRNKKLQKAYKYMKRSINLFEVIGRDLINDNRKIFFYGHSTHIYLTMLFICRDINKHKEMFEYLERSKSKALLDIIATTEIKPSRGLEKEKTLLGEEKRYYKRLREIQFSFFEGINDRIDLYEVDKIIEKLYSIYDRFEEIDPEYVSMRKRLSLSFEQIQKILTR